MRYWIFHNNQVLGPYEKEALVSVPGFSPESLVCPEGRKGTELGDWQRVNVVAELADILPQKEKVSTAVLSQGRSAFLPPDPTLKDLAALGSLQEKVHMLESSLSQLQEKLQARENELNTKSRETAALHSKIEELEKQIASTGGLKAELAKTQEEERATATTQSELAKTLEELHGHVRQMEESQKELRQELEKIKAQSMLTQPSPTMQLSEPTPMEPSPVPTLSSTSFLESSQQPPALEELGPTNFQVPPEQMNPMDIPITSPAIQSEIPPGISLQNPGEFQAGQKAPEPVTPVLFSKSPPKPTTEPELESGIVDLSVGGAARTHRKRTWKVVRRMMLGMIFLAAGGAGVAYNMGYIDIRDLRTLQNLLQKVSGKLLETSGGAGAPYDADETQKLPVDVHGGIPDRTQEAVEIARSYALPDGKTLGALLEADQPPSGLSPWMVERMDEDKYQVNFYSQKQGKAAQKSRYEFEVRLGAKSVRGLNPGSQSLLETRTAPAPGARRKRGKRNPEAAKLLEESIGTEKASPSSSQEQPQDAQTPQDFPQAETTESPSETSQSPAPVKKPQPQKEPSLDELLLPGVPKPKGGNSELEKLINSK